MRQNSSFVHDWSCQTKGLYPEEYDDNDLARFSPDYQHYLDHNYWDDDDLWLAEQHDYI